MRSRRALFGVLAGGAAAMGWGMAEACSYSRQDCRGFRRDLRAAPTLVRGVAEAVRTATIPGPDDFEYDAVYDVTVRTTDVVTGMALVDRVYETRARLFDCGGTILGYLPKAGDEVILTLERDRTSGGWKPTGLDSAERFDRMWSKCGST